MNAWPVAVVRVGTVSIAAALLLTQTCWATPSERPIVAPALQPPRSAKVVAEIIGAGNQIYECVQRDSNLVWAPKRTDATLSDIDGNSIGTLNEGPTWRASDGSTLVGKTEERAPASRVDALPWVLYATGSKGEGRFTGVRFVQRIETVKGLGPAEACSHAGEERPSQFAAVFVLYR